MLHFLESSLLVNVLLCISVCVLQPHNAALAYVVHIAMCDVARGLSLRTCITSGVYSGKCCPLPE